MERERGREKREWWNERRRKIRGKQKGREKHDRERETGQKR